jgi:hypothetical protein
MKALRPTLRERQAEGAKPDVAANLPVRRNNSEGGKELGYGG